MLVAWGLMRECDLNHICAEIFFAIYVELAQNLRKSTHAKRAARTLCILVRSRLDQFAERSDIQHNDRAMLEANPIPGGPYPQLLVDALPGHADHLADFLLGDRDGTTCGLKLALLRQTYQRAGKPTRQVLKNDLFDLLAGPSQPHAEQFDELHRQCRLAFHERKKFAPVNDENLA